MCYTILPYVKSGQKRNSLTVPRKHKKKKWTPKENNYLIFNGIHCNKS